MVNPENTSKTPQKPANYRGNPQNPQKMAKVQAKKILKNFKKLKKFDKKKLYKSFRFFAGFEGETILCGFLWVFEVFSGLTILYGLVQEKCKKSQKVFKCRFVDVNFNLQSIFVKNLIQYFDKTMKYRYKYLKYE
jgi:hypothetical protein